VTTVSKILVVDDAGSVRRWCVRVLASSGHEVLQAADGAEAVELYRRERPDAVVLDVMMPGIDGLETLASIRRTDPHARVLMLSSVAELQTCLEARQLGARDYVVKPCESAHLTTRVERALAAA
jgi:two-component system chemotaxis response regulator CheY